MTIYKEPYRYPNLIMLTDIELLILRKEVKEMGFEEDKEFILEIDKILKERNVKIGRRKEG